MSKKSFTVEGPPQRLKSRAPASTKPLGGGHEGPKSPLKKQKFKDLENLPKKTPELPRRINGNDLMKRWSKKDFEIIAYHRELNLNIYYPSGELRPKNSSYPIIIEHAIFDLTEVEEFEKKYPVLLKEEVLNEQMNGEQKVSKNLTDLKYKKEEYLKDPELIEMLKKARFETDTIYDDVKDTMAQLKHSGYHLADIEKKLKEKIVEAFEDLTKYQEFKFMKKKYLEDQKLYEGDPAHPKRYFVGKLLKKIAKDKDNYPKGIKGKGNYQKLYDLSE
jgi:hypothetical protein